jgi:hypothetical protein
MSFLRNILRCGNPPAREPVGPLNVEEQEISKHLCAHVHALAEEIGERNLFRYESLERSAAYIEETFRSCGWEVSDQAFAVERRMVRNIEAKRRGSISPEEIVVVGAHYDSVCGSPGANDNASGVAAILELARLFVTRAHDRTLRLVTFVNEEPPFFRSRYMGSRVYARRARGQGENILAMLSVETIGYYSGAIGSQGYPFPLGLLYPHVPDFIGIVGNIQSHMLVRRCINSFRKHSAFPAEALTAPAWMMGVGWSDHWAFWQEGYRAAMITDTALFRYPYYHSFYDTPGRLDYPSTARVVSGIGGIVQDLLASKRPCC